MLIGRRKKHVVDAFLLHKVDSDLLGEARKGWDTVDMIVWCIVFHHYHLQSGIVTGGERYNFSSYQFHKHLTIHVIMLVSCM